MPYVDGFVLAVPKQNLAAYKDLARKAGEVWKEHGALAYVECAGDDVPYGELTSFPRAVQAKEDEIVVFAWIVHASREQRDATNAKVMADPRLKGEMANMPFDGQAHDLRRLRDVPRALRGSPLAPTAPSKPATTRA